MSWQEKMNFIIAEVLGEGYEVKVINDNTFEVYFVDILLLKTETAYTVPNHWRTQVKETIDLIINQKTKDAFLKLDK